MNCEFCKNKLKTTSSLNYHKKNNKNCLSIQSQINAGKLESALVSCSHCSKIFSISNINKHSSTCKKKKNTIESFQSKINKLKEMNIKLEFEKNYIQSDNEKLQSEISKLKEINIKLEFENNYLISDIEELQSEINELYDVKEMNIKLEVENNIYKKDHDTITSIAKQSKINTTNYNLSVYDDNIIKNRFTTAISNATPADLYDGQKSIGRFVAPCLQNEDGTKMIACSDFSRNIFITKDCEGNVNKDIKCRNLANLIEPIATAKVDELMKEDNDKRWKFNRILFLKKNIITKEEEIDKLENHILGLKKETQKWYYTKSQILQNENDIKIFMNELEKIEEDDAKKYSDDKLVVAADDIKDMKKDSGKFSKTISELV